MAPPDRDTMDEPVGPFAPPHAKEVERTDGAEPMAVANDQQTMHDESFHPTTAPREAYAREVARRYRQVPPKRTGVARDRKMRDAGDVPRFSEPDARGWAKPIPDETPEEE